jgi:predicted O-methyltransferase YrrM
MIVTDKTRIDLAELFTGIGVEVGVEKAIFSKQIAKHSTKLYCVDPYMKYDGYRENVTQEKMDSFYARAQHVMTPYTHEFIREPSREAVKRFEDNSLDFVYIDANHSYESAKEDIMLWSQKVKEGGIVAGHDYLDTNGYGVKRAVDELYKDITIWNGDTSPSWSYIK